MNPPPTSPSFHSTGVGVSWPMLLNLFSTMASFSSCFLAPSGSLVSNSDPNSHDLHLFVVPLKYVGVPIEKVDLDDCVATVQMPSSLPPCIGYSHPSSFPAQRVAGLLRGEA